MVLLARGTAGILDRRLAVVGVGFALLVAASTLVFKSSLDLALLDGLYFVVITVTTTGYGDISLLEASPSIKLAGIATMILGALVLAPVFGLVTDAIVGARLARALGQQPVPRRRHVIVCGVGRPAGASSRVSWRPAYRASPWNATRASSTPVPQAASRPGRGWRRGVAGDTRSIAARVRAGAHADDRQRLGQPAVRAEDARHQGAPAIGPPGSFGNTYGYPEVIFA